MESIALTAWQDVRTVRDDSSPSSAAAAAAAAAVHLVLRQLSHESARHSQQTKKFSSDV
jgi:hypothetical protein